MRTKGFVTITALVIMLLLTGCFGVGPKTVVRDRFHYTESIAESWKNEMLLNLVKLRYADFPVFLDISGVVNQYSLEGSVNVGLTSGPAQNQSQFVGGTGKYADKPTITYTPIIGSRFIKSILNPLPPRALFSLVQAGWPVDFVMRTCVQSVNGVSNRQGSPIVQRPADAEYYELLNILRYLQKTGDIAMRLEDTGNSLESLLFIIKKHDDLSMQTILERKAQSKRIRQILDISEDVESFKVTYGTLPKSDNEIALITRSMLTIMVDMAASIRVPQEHVEEGRVPAMFSDSPPAGKTSSVPSIESSDGMPSDYYARAKYLGNWFYIDGKDLNSKRVFSFLMLLFSLSETGAGSTSGPLLTIPTN